MYIIMIYIKDLQKNLLQIPIAHHLKVIPQLHLHQRKEIR